ncbi:MAG TPA: hypothetical protein VFD05_01130 [Bacilli bacterium]|nr:hypothetical protein [Bacilli bacterium]
MKLKKILPVILSVFLLTGCKEIYADALPELKDPAEWGEIYEITLESSVKNQLGEEDLVLKQSSVLRFYENGASFFNDQTMNDERNTMDEHLYKTSDSFHFITVTNGEQEESDTYGYDYDFTLSVFHLLAEILYYPFEIAYTNAEDIVDQDAVNEIYASVPAIESLKLTKSGDTFKLDIKGVTEVENDEVYDSHVIIEFNAKGGIPRFVKTKSVMKDGKKVVVESFEEVVYTYRETLPKYNGPTVK